MSKKLVIILANTDLRNGDEIGPPIFQASLAASMEYEVDVYCTGPSGQLMKKGIAEGLVSSTEDRATVYDHIRAAHDAGAKFFCCSPTLDLFDMTEEDLIPECEGILGGSHVIEEIMESDCRILSY